MMWVLILTSGIILWIASLVKVLHFSHQNSYPSSLQKGGVVEKRNVLLVIAHPDDESMFFSPTINHLTSRGHKVHVLCFSVGNADGLGNIRKQELYQACAVHGILPHQVKVLDVPELQDGFNKKWDHCLLSDIIEDEIISHGIEVIITFDGHGVSGHCNHQDVHYGVWKFLHVTSQRDVEAWELVSTNIIRKYIGPVDIWLSIALYGSNRSMHCLQNEHPRKSFNAMSQHSSQWVWFRKLFVSFSSYTYINTLRRMND